MKYIVTILVLVSLNAVAGSKIDIVKNTFSPIVEATLDNTGGILETFGVASNDLEFQKLIPKEIHPTRLLNRDEIRDVTYQAIASSLTLQEAKDIALFFSTELGKISVESYKIAIKEDRDINAVTQELLSTHDINVLEKEVTSLFSIEDMMQIKKSMSGVGHNIMTAGIELVNDKIESYYEGRKFGKNDSRLCEYSFENEKDLLAAPVCEAGLKAKHFQSSMSVAALHWQGRFKRGQRDIEEAKRIYKSILDQDKNGEGHYYLAMLMKNAL